MAKPGYPVVPLDTSASHQTDQCTVSVVMSGLNMDDRWQRRLLRYHRHHPGVVNGLAPGTLAICDLATGYSASTPDIPDRNCVSGSPPHRSVPPSARRRPSLSEARAVTADSQRATGRSGDHSRHGWLRPAALGRRRQMYHRHSVAPQTRSPPLTPRETLADRHGSPISPAGDRRR